LERNEAKEEMIGFYDYTVVLTYMSLVSACIGIYASMYGAGHPYVGTMFLMLCGLCDTFDGKVARSKKNRTDKEKEFGIQIDSFSDIVAFGVLPTCIGIALYKRDLLDGATSVLAHVPLVVLVIIGALFVLCALIRLAWFNITVEETQSDSLGNEKYYFGLPVTSTALIFPTFLLVRYFLGINISYVYYILLILVGILFVMKFKLKKPNSKEIYMLVAIGAVEFLVVLAIKLLTKH
jgi:CDP-diacylglycerol--serine O-phosphatidyltransferase